MSMGQPGPLASRAAVEAVHGGNFAEPEDVLVFEHDGPVFRLLGGRGRGAGWAGQVVLKGSDTALVGRAWRVGHTAHHETDRPRQVAGPYHATHAAAVPVGQKHVVVFGSRVPFSGVDGDLLRAAVAAVDGTCGVPTEKLLADELEVVDAVRTLMAFRPTSVRETCRHVAAVTARALSCDVAAISFEHAAETVVEGVGFGVDGPVPGPHAGAMLGGAARLDRLDVEQASSDGPALFGIDVSSRMMLPLSSGTLVGALAVGHATSRPRGFTMLCQRIGRAIVESADVLLAQAVAHEELDARIHHLTRASGMDALTGVANRRGWDEALAVVAKAERKVSHAVISCDVDDMKEVNDRLGHAAGDAVLLATAQLLSRCVRSDDVVARTGGDEFAVLLRGADQATAEAVVRRIRRTEARQSVRGFPARVRVSLGMAIVEKGATTAAEAIADERMYSNKRRRKARKGRGP